MITLLTGSNSYEIEQALGRIVAAFDGEPERFDGAELELRQLPDLLAGMSLFAEKRLVIIRGLASNKQVWEALHGMLGRMSDDIHLVLVEPSLDKRTKTYKALQKVADIKDHQLLTERDSYEAERWIVDKAKSMGMNLDKAAARELLKRSLAPAERGQPVVDQWRIAHSLEKLSVLSEVTPSEVERYIDSHPVESVFGLFETALRGDLEEVHRLLAELEQREDPFMVFGLLSGQVFQLAALAMSDQPSAEVAKTIGVHPFAASKLAPFAKKLSKRDLQRVVVAFSDADEAMKLSKAPPWVLIEQALVKAATT